MIIWFLAKYQKDFFLTSRILIFYMVSQLDRCVMIQIHPKIIEQFDTLLLQKNILKKHHPDYRKWLRRYLDFCNKYNYDNLKKETLYPCSIVTGRNRFNYFCSCLSVAIFARISQLRD